MHLGESTESELVGSNTYNIVRKMIATEFWLSLQFRQRLYLYLTQDRALEGDPSFSICSVVFDADGLRFDYPERNPRLPWEGLQRRHGATLKMFTYAYALIT